MSNEDSEEAVDEGWTWEDLDHLQVGDHVRHRSFGVGTVRNLTEEYITCFVGGRERVFAFPGAFEGGYLSLD